MNKSLFHGTKDYLKVLDAGRVVCPALLNSLNIPIQEQELLFNHYDNEYQSLVRKCKEVVLNSNLYDGKNINGTPITGLSDEEIADHISFFGNGNSEISLAARYKELTRLTHVFLGDLDTARSYAVGKEGRILKFSLPEEILRPGHHEKWALVKKEIPLEHMTEIH